MSSCCQSLPSEEPVGLDAEANAAGCYPYPITYGYGTCSTLSCNTTA